MKDTPEKVGYFDENIYPAYLEDCDYHYRSKLVNTITRSVETHMVHGEAPNWGSSTIGDKNGALRKSNHITHGKNYVYYDRKWGGREGGETYQTPFNDPNNSVKFWPEPKDYLLW
jgi:GT2 family glycosyltransferase